MTSLPRPKIIDTQDALERLTEHLLRQTHIAVDTESNSLYAYREQVCLIQISTENDDYLVDPLAIDDLVPLATVFADPSVQKIFHAAEYDIMCLRRDYQYQFNALFDTMLASRILGHKQIGLASILETNFGVKVSKRHQRADWGRRPLSREMLKYAQIDTHYLISVRNSLHAELEARGHLEEAKETFDELLTTKAHSGKFDPDAFWNINGTRDLQPRQQAILRELYLFREQIARKRDTPPFKVMSEKTLLELARREPASIHRLEKTRILSDSQLRRIGRGIVRRVQDGKQAKSPRRPRQQRPDDALLDRYEVLRKWRKERAHQRGVESDVIMSKDILWQLAKRAPHSHQQLEAIQSLGPWKRKTYGGELLQLINEQPAFKADT